MIRHEFRDSSTKENDVHPSSIFDRERLLAESFIGKKMATQSPGIANCPVSGLKRHEVLFTKWGVAYALCSKTWSVAMAQPPQNEVLKEYFEDSELAAYRASDTYQRIVSSTRQDLWNSWLEWIEIRAVRHLGHEAYHVIDFGAKSAGWVKSLSSAPFVRQFASAEPVPPLARSAEDGATADVVTFLDVLQRTFNPTELLEHAKSFLRPGGIILGSCRAGSGFDVLTLREESDSIFPLDHVTLPSPMGMEILLRRCGLEVLEISTPGLFDVALVKKCHARIPKDQFFQRFVASALEELGLERLQSFLQANGLSSHLRFVARKPLQ